MSRKRMGGGSGRQVAALPFTEQEGETKVMLVTSRETRRWVLPKGWAEKSLTGHELAVKEAFEEAGVIGVTLSNQRTEAKVGCNVLNRMTGLGMPTSDWVR